MHDGLPPPMMLSAEQVAHTLGVNRTTLWRWVQSGQFPKPVPLAGETTRYCVAEVEAFIEARKALRGA